MPPSYILFCFLAYSLTRIQFHSTRIYLPTLLGPRKRRPKPKQSAHKEPTYYWEGGGAHGEKQHVHKWAVHTKHDKIIQGNYTVRLIRKGLMFELALKLNLKGKRHSQNEGQSRKRPGDRRWSCVDRTARRSLWLSREYKMHNQPRKIGFHPIRKSLKCQRWHVIPEATDTQGRASFPSRGGFHFRMAFLIEEM